MSVLPKSSIKAVAESLGIYNLKDDIAEALTQDVEYRVREIAQEAVKFMRHSKRKKLTVDDVNHALKVRNIEPMYGFSSSQPVKYKPIPDEPGYFYAQDDLIDIESLISAPLPDLPREISFTSHWLAVEGVQPRIPENPHPASANKSDLKAKNPSALGPASGSSAAASGVAPTGPVDSAAPMVTMKPLVRHVLSAELQLFYDKVTVALISDDDDIRRAALSSLQTDSGLSQLLPYLIQFIADKVKQNSVDLKQNSQLMAAIKAILDNSSLFVDPYLHQFMPTILTCIVGKRLCQNPAKEDHWTLRDRAAAILGHIVNAHGKAYANLSNRVIATLLGGLDPKMPLTTNYGAIVALRELGHEKVRHYLLPIFKQYGVILSTIRNARAEASKKAAEADHVWDALLRAGGEYLKTELRSVTDGKTVIPGGKSSSLTNDENEPMDIDRYPVADELSRNLAANKRSLTDALPRTASEYSELYGLFGEPLFNYVHAAGDLLAQCL